MSLKRLLTTAAVALCTPSFACADVVTWGAATNIVDGTDILTTGTLVEAFNGAATSVSSNPVAGGVTFTSTGALLPDNASNDVFTLSTGDAGYNQLLSNVDFGGGTSPTLTLGGGSLVAGDQYQIQIWFADTRDGTNGRVMRYSDGNGNTVDLNDQYSIGTFTADDGNIDITLLPQGFGNAHINGYQIRTLPAVVPEPSGLIAIGLLACGGFMRRRR